MPVEIKGFSYRPKDIEGAGEGRGLAYRIYGTREVFKYSDGRLAPQPGTWEMVCEVKITRRRGRVSLSTFELETTGPGGWRFYNPVYVDHDGREVWHPDNEIIFPREMLSEFDEIDFPTLLLYNMELKGVIAPGQLHD